MYFPRFLYLSVDFYSLYQSKSKSGEHNYDALVNFCKLWKMGEDMRIEVFYHISWLFEFWKNFLCAKTRIYGEMNFLYIVPVKELFSKFFNEILSRLPSRMNFLESQVSWNPLKKINFRHVSTIFPFCQKSKVLLH